MMAETAKIPELINGMGDVIFAFGQLLANAGLLDRRDLAAAFRAAAEQGAQQEGSSGGDPASRTLIARVLAEVFSRPLAGDRSGLRIIDGGGRHLKPRAARPSADEHGFAGDLMGARTTL